MFVTVFLKDFFVDLLDFYVGRKKKLNLVISPPDKTKSIYVTVLSSQGSITYFDALLLAEI